MSMDNLMKAVEPVFKMTAESNLQVKTLWKHYVKTISELTGKTENEINKELDEIHSKVKENEIENLKNSFDKKE